VPTAFAARAPRQTCVLAAIVALHVGAFVLVSAGMGNAGVELPLATLPISVLPLPPPDAPVARPEPAGAPDYAPPAVDRPTVFIPREEDAPESAGASGHVGHAGADAVPPPVIQHPSLRTRDRRLAAMIDACYPSVARRMGWEGRVSAVVTIDAAGRAAAWRVDESSGYPPLDNAIACVLRRLEFAPGRRDGRAIEAAVRLPIVFRLD
jgi:protein TonB